MAEKENGAARKPAIEDVREQNKTAAVQFKAQHGLLVAFFLLILYFSPTLSSETL